MDGVVHLALVSGEVHRFDPLSRLIEATGVDHEPVFRPIMPVLE